MDLDDAFKLWAEALTMGGDQELATDALTHCLHTSARRMLTRVPKHLEPRVQYILDNVVTVSNVLSFVDFLCGYYHEDLGLEAVYRVGRFLRACQNTPKNARYVFMAAQDAANYLRQTLF